MNETRRTKDWITPEILEKSHQKHLMVSREAIDTSDNVGAPLAEAQNILSTFVPNVNDIVSLSSLFDRRFFKLFLLGIALSGLLSLCTIGSQQFFGANKYDWVSLNSSGRSLMWTRRYDEAEKCFKTALALPNLDSAEKACLYGELANLAEKRGDENAAREYSLKEKEFSQVGFGVGSMILAAILLFAMGLSAMFTFKSDKDKVAVGWHQPVEHWWSNVQSPRIAGPGTEAQRASSSPGAWRRARRRVLQHQRRPDLWLARPIPRHVARRLGEDHDPW